MKKLIEKIIEKLEEYRDENLVEHDSEMANHCKQDCNDINDCTLCVWDKAIEIVKQEAEKFVPDTNVGNNGWIPCGVTMPPVETEVFIVAKRKYRGGEVRYITTTAMYEDGTVLENDSCWRWEDIEGEWDEENDCYIIPEGWWENRHYNPDEVYNNVIDDEVVAWQPLPQPYQPKGE